jgi:hypothetical protein
VVPEIAAKQKACAATVRDIAEGGEALLPQPSNDPARRFLFMLFQEQPCLRKITGLSSMSAR